MKISYSSFETFNRCPLQYKYSYIERIKTPDKPELYFGSLIHEIVQYALKKDPIIPQEEELILMLKKGWKKEIFASDKESEQYFAFGIEMLKKFYNDWKPGFRNIVATEKRFFIPLNDKHSLTGIIDRIDKLPFGAFEIIDYKTSKALPSQIDVDKDNQLTIYRLAMESLWPDVQDVRLTLYFLKHDKKLTTLRRPDEVEEIKNQVIKTADNIEKEQQFIPKLNSLCGWCGYQNICPLWFAKGKSAASEKDKSDTDIDLVIEEYFDAQQKMLELQIKIHSHFDTQKIDRYFHKKGILTRHKNKNFSWRKMN